ncbi:MAG: hypothetical protein NTX44_10470 [Ignavibacteriales bacterium]|nr:hypothetical protein [Ignavibacteriales bacterium]
MKNKLSVFFLLFSFLNTISVNAQLRKVIDINQDWKFKKENVDGAQDISYDDSEWETVRLPHTWNNLDGQDGGNNYYRGIGWYRKSMSIASDFSGKKVYLKFNSANCKTDVHINGVLVGSHIGSYAAFIFDITKYISFGKLNTIAVKVDNSATVLVPPLSADFTFFGGITRTVELLVLNPVNISPLLSASSGVFLTQSKISNASANIKISTMVDNNLSKTSNVKVTAKIITREGSVLDSTYTIVKIAGNRSQNIEQLFSIKNPHLWNGKSDPYLYTVIVEVYKNKIKTDSMTQPLGLRFYSIDANSGFYLNGKKYPLHGVAFHEERRDKGRAISMEDRKQDMDILNELGCTYLRLAHYQHDQFIYNYCDENGIIVWTEIPVVNNIDTSTTLYAENAKQQLTELIRQNYNHPSVCFWGLFNEVDFRPGPDPTPLIRELNNLAHTLDSTRLTTAAAMFDDRQEHWIPDVISWNKYFGWYFGNYKDFSVWLDSIHAKHPNSKIGVSEYGVGANTQDHSQNPSQPNPGGPFHPEEYQNIYHEIHWNGIEKHPFLFSTSLWVGFDFSSDGRNEGKNPGVNDKGLVTQDRKIKKDAYYFYKANWNDEPMVYISSRRFTQRQDSLVEVKIYSNCDSVQLQVNDKTYSILISSDHIYKWNNVTLDSGANKILALGYRKGQIVSDTCTWYFVRVVSK